MSEDKVKSVSDCGIKRYDTRDLIVREDILNKAKELAHLISTSAEVEFYKRAEKKIKEHEHLQNLISQIKKKQKEIVAFERFENREMVKKIEGEIEKLQDEIDSIPIVAEFKQAQDDLNYLLQLIVSVIRDTVSELIEVESGTVTPSSCSES